jgi:hypothetical protein
VKFHLDKGLALVNTFHNISSFLSSDAIAIAIHLSTQLLPLIIRIVFRQLLDPFLINTKALVDAKLSTSSTIY